MKLHCDDRTIFFRGTGQGRHGTALRIFRGTGADKIAMTRIWAFIDNEPPERFTLDAAPEKRYTGKTMKSSENLKAALMEKLK